MNEGSRPATAGRVIIRKPPTDEQIKAFESEFQIDLPDDYLALLRFANGGHPKCCLFKPSDKREPAKWTVNVFYHLDDDKNSLTGLWRQNDAWKGVVAHTTITVADDPCGDQIVLSYDSKPPNVKLIVHDGMYLLNVANSFAEFISMLEPDQ